MENIIKPIYERLKGYLAQLPSIDVSSDIYSEEIWKQFNDTVDELNKITGQDYNQHKIKAIYYENGSHASTVLVRTKHNGLISQLRSEYFPSEPEPFAGAPSTIVSQTQNQQQNQELHLQMILEFQSKIDEKLNEVQDGSKEKTFLEKIKSSLSKIKDYSQMLHLILTTGKDVGLTIDEIIKIFT